MNAKALLNNFVRHGVVIEGRGRKAVAAAAAILALGSVARVKADGPFVGVAAERVIRAQFAKGYPDLPSMGILHDETFPKMKVFSRRNDPGQPAGDQDTMLKNHTGKPVTVDYGRIVGDIRAQVEAEFPGKIYIVDRSKPAVEEAANIAKRIGKALSARERFVIGGDPHSSPAIGPRTTVCVVVGPQPELDVRDMTASFIEDMFGDKESFEFRGGPGISAELWHALMIWHEVGHCLLGSSEARADTFSVLKMMADLKQTDFVDFLIAVREVMERISDPTDYHIISPTLRDAVENYGNADFMEKPHTLRELGEIVKGIETPIDARTILIRNWIAWTRYDDKRKDFDAKRASYLVPVKEGYVVSDFCGWLKSASSIPEVGRINELLAYLTGDPATRKTPEPFRPNPEASAKAVMALAEAGDPTVRVIAAVFGVKHLSSEKPLSGTEALPSHEEVPGRLIAFDRTGAAVKFSNDLRSFLVRDSITKRPLMAGNAERGITRTFEAFHDRVHPVETGYAGPRR